jgi:hypothetical protein
MTLATEGRRPAGGSGRRLLCALTTLVFIAATTPTDLRSMLDKTDRAIGQAERAVGGKDPGKVSLILIRADELLASFLSAGELEALVKVFDEARAAARASDMPAAAAAVRRASGLMSPLTDFVVLRQSAESSRAALRAAETRDPAAFMDDLDRFDASILAPVLLARVREARAAVSRARQAMVRNNMQDGRARIAEVRRAFSGLVYAGALSRASYSLTIGSELLSSGSLITARDQMQKAMRDLKLALGAAPDDTRTVLEDAHAQTTGIWKRSGHAAPGDAGRLADLARAIDGVRLNQPR